MLRDSRERDCHTIYQFTALNRNMALPVILKAVGVFFVLHEFNSYYNFSDI